MNNNEFQQAKRVLSNWDGYSHKGQRAYETMFEAEKQQMDDYEMELKYAGMSTAQKQQAMQAEYDEISAGNEAYDYYND